LLVEFQRLGREVVHLLGMDPLGVPSSHPEQARHRIFGDVDEAGGGTHPAAFTEMVDDGRRLFLWELGIEQGGATPLGELLAARATAQQANTVMAIHLPDHEVVRASAAKQLAFGVDTG
jgi:hypothetical protein